MQGTCMAGEAPTNLLCIPVGLPLAVDLELLLLLLPAWHSCWWQQRHGTTVDALPVSQALLKHHPAHHTHTHRSVDTLETPPGLPAGALPTLPWHRPSAAAAQQVHQAA